ncbi:MAG: hypothetical protein WDM78_05005 [Puia sp.]
MKSGQARSNPCIILNIENDNHIRVIRLAGDEIEEQQVFEQRVIKNCY